MTNETSPTGERIPATVGRYQITGPLGFGAMGAVYKAFDPLIKRTLAIKTIRLDVPRQSEQHKAFIERFYQEARISGTLSHPSIVTLFDIGEEGGVPFLAMEFIDGRTIAAYIEEGTRFKPEKVVALVSQVAAALDYAHSRGVVHRDIKPSNLMLYDADKVKVTDFGIAKLADTDITHAGALLGTPSYMSPEQAMGERLDGRSDIFSLGVCAFEMLSGQQPFPGANVTSILYKLVHVDPVQPLDLEQYGLLPQKWHDVFAKVLAKKPADRYQTACEFVRDLEYCLGSWFTGLGDETAVVAAAGVREPEATVLVAAVEPASAPEPAPPTAAMPILAEPEPAPAAAAPSADVEATVLMPQVAAADDASPATVVMTAVPADDDVPATVLMPPVPASAPLQQRALAAEFTRRPPADASQTLPPMPATSPRPSAAAPARGDRRGVAAALVIGGAGIVAVATLGLVGYALWRRAQAEAPVAMSAPAPTTIPASPAAIASTPPSAAPVVLGTLHVESEPAGARVLVNGEPRGKTPLDLAELPLGDYALRLEQRGYDSRTQRLSLGRDNPSAQVKVTLVRATPVTGTADIVSSPAGAAVTIDGRPSGRTPLSRIALKPGSRNVQLELPGYEPWSGSVDVVVRQNRRLDARLNPVPPPKPVVATPEPVDPARVYPESEVDQKPRRLSGDSASYPSNAPRLKSGQRVSVLLQFVVTDSGEVRDPKVVESGGKTVDDAVLAAVRRWKFAPAVKQGTKVKSLTAFRQTFLGG